MSHSGLALEITSDLAQETQEKIEAADKIRGCLQDLSPQMRSELLKTIGQQLAKSYATLAAANKKDIEFAKDTKLRKELVDRLSIPPKETLVELFAETAEFPDIFAKPFFESKNKTIRSRILGDKNFFSEVRGWRVPLGVVGQIYESRPSVTLIGTAMGIKTGNNLLFKGGKEAIHSNSAIVELVQDQLEKSKLPRAAVQLLIDDSNYTATKILITSHGKVDVAVIRGGAKTIGELRTIAQVPLIITGAGVVHAYVHKSANLVRAIDSIVFAKIKGTSWCSCTDSILIDQSIAGDFLPKLHEICLKKSISLFACPRSHSHLKGASLVESEDFWHTEHLKMAFSVKIVDDSTDAIAHIRKFSTGHTDVIYADDRSVTHSFERQISSSAIIVNGPSILHGAVFENRGYNYNFGISTEKLHVRGVIGLDGLTTTKYCAVSQWPNQEQNEDKFGMLG